MQSERLWLRGRGWAGRVRSVIRNVILDWSGTLVDDLPAVLQASNYVFRQAGVAEMTLDQFRREFRLPFTEFYKRHVPHITMTRLEAWFHLAFRQCQHMVVEIPHAREFLVFCRERGLRTFLLSSVHGDHFAAQAAETGFGDYLDRVYIEVRDKRARISSLLEEHQLAPRETLFVGDMEHDIETARAGGVYACAVLTGYNHLEQLSASKPDLIVEHLGQLRARLAQGGFESTAAGSALGVAPAAGDERVPVPTVGALIWNDAGEVLLVRTAKWSDKWSIPGGKIEYGETTAEALSRELKEETGLDVFDIRLALVQDCINSPEFFRDAHFILLNYQCRCRDTAHVRLNAEAQEFRWLKPEHALALPLNQPTRVLIEKALSAPMLF